MLGALAFLFYLVPAAPSPPSVDEVALMRQAQSVATSGRDTDGHAAQLYFRASEEHWLQPVPVYATALVSALVSGSMAARLASTIVGALNVGLIYLLMRRLCPNRWGPLATAALLAITPAHLAFARSGVDAIYSLPFVLVWLIGLRDFLDRGDQWHLTAGVFALGVGAYTQPSAPLTMGFLFAITCAALWITGARGIRAYAGIVTAFALPLSIAGLWFAAHPSSYADTFGRWVIHAAHLRSPMDGIRAFLNWTTLGTRTSLYWGFFDPSWLFFNAPYVPGTVLRGAAPFLLPASLFSLMGVARCARVGPPAWTIALVAGAAASPLAASTFGQPHAIGAALAVVPFVTVLAGCGLVDWSERKGAAWRWLGWAAIAAIPLQFIGAYPRYF